MVINTQALLRFQVASYPQPAIMRYQLQQPYHYPKGGRQRRLEVIARVAFEHGLTVGDLIGPCKRKEYVAARWQAMKAIKTEFPNDSLTTIGRLFKRDHTTVIHALRSAAE
jgi:chromosomal replication initiation ATPase DnaA